MVETINIGFEGNISELSFDNNKRQIYEKNINYNLDKNDYKGRELSEDTILNVDINEFDIQLENSENCLSKENDNNNNISEEIKEDDNNNISEEIKENNNNNVSEKIKENDNNNISEEIKEDDNNNISEEIKEDDNNNISEEIKENDNNNILEEIKENDNNNVSEKIKEDDNNNISEEIKEDIKSKESVESKINENFNCMVCFEELKKDDIDFYNIDCGHKFCSECWSNYLEVKIKEFEDILCMEKTCLKKIPDEKVKKFLKNDKELIIKFEKNILKRKIENNPYMKFCPYPDCEGYGIITNNKDEKNNYIKCTLGHKFCFNCLKPWHEGKKCKEKLDNNLKKWKDKNNSKRCPKCGILILKNEGCNHITCRNCKYEFCWICLGKYTNNHFYTGGCFQNKEWKICEFKIVRIIYKFFFFFLFYLLYCLLTLPFIILIVTDSIFYRKKIKINSLVGIFVLFPYFVSFEILYFCLFF